MAIDLKKISKAVRKFAKKPSFLVLTILIIAASLSAYYFWARTLSYRENPNKAAEEDIKNTIANVSKLIVLPAGEEPTVATVSNPEQLRNQPFFAKAKRGDKVLIFANAGKVILYDPVINKIIDVATVNVDAQNTNLEEAPAPTPQFIPGDTPNF